jgi:hypothetical protein
MGGASQLLPRILYHHSPTGDVRFTTGLFGTNKPSRFLQLHTLRRRAVSPAVTSCDRAMLSSSYAPPIDHFTARNNPQRKARPVKRLMSLRKSLNTNISRKSQGVGPLGTWQDLRVTGWKCELDSAPSGYDQLMGLLWNTVMRDYYYSQWSQERYNNVFLERHSCCEQ